MHGIARYRKQAVQSAAPQQIVILLLEESLKRLRFAQVLDPQTDTSAFIGHLHHVREILFELDNALNFEVSEEFCADMRNLYRWSRDELIAAGKERTHDRIPGVYDVIKLLLEGWRSTSQ